ncbi:BTB/POZ domain-containing protein [Moritella yayanosii]|uniref:Uncharacterized protein n=1 Tax=Moritella yayanosii TaxID=69539 RepID=A0A330LS94_9GAMM|nr:YgfB and YecA [Moritella yayanosii]SQD79593.1 protein of unknown function [Moritella yayanosii]
MNRVDYFWSLWKEALMRTINLGLDPSFDSTFIFKSISSNEYKQVKEKIEVAFVQIIKSLDLIGQDRNLTRLNCSLLAHFMQQELNKLGIRSIVVTGDYKFVGEYMYEVDHDYLVRELKGKNTGGLALHCWLVLENYMLVDPTRMIYHEKEKFINYEIDGIPLIEDIESVPEGLFYHPYILGDEYLKRINAL